MATNASHSDFKVSPQLHCGTPRKISQGWPDGATENPEVKHENQKPEMNSNNTGTGTGTILAQSHFGLFIYQLMLVHHVSGGGGTLDSRSQSAGTGKYLSTL